MTNTDQVFKSLPPKRIRTINRGLTNKNSVYFTQVFKGPKARFFSVIDLALMFNSNDVSQIFHKRTNLESAITLCSAAALQNAEATLTNNLLNHEWRENCEKKIFDCERFDQEYDLGRFTCKLKSTEQIASDISNNNSADWWTWQLNEYYKNIYGYSTQMRVFINGDRIIEPSYEDREVIVFDRPRDLADGAKEFILEVTLNDDTSGEKIVFKAPLPFN